MIRLTFLTTLALLAFAANSLLARAALASGGIGPAEFTLIRLICGAVTLCVLILITQRSAATLKNGSWRGAAMLLLYAAGFSFAYVTLETGMGALALFAAVQLTMLGYALACGRLGRQEMIGAVIAFAGFIYLILPALSGTAGAHSLGLGFALMTLAGIGWGVYSLIGQGSVNPLAQTAGNFWRASLLSLPLLALALSAPSLSHQGVALAALSGAVTSGLGYAIWYAALPGLRPSLASVLQLLVPPLAALMGWIALKEPITARLAIATAVISLGLFIVAQYSRGKSKP